ncbi:MAG: glycosyltransferase family 9 protein [Bacteroidia bacterium]|nr:glycosyltransferase family 9 protein [Bacteroidia bacterium]
MKVLIARFSSIGDVVLTTPVIRCVKKQVPNCEVHFVTKKAFAGLVKTNPYIDKVWELKDDFNTLVNELKSENFDVLIDLHNNLRTKRLRFNLGIKRLALDKINLQKWLIVNLKVNRLPDVHIVQRNLDVVKSLGVVDDQQGLDYFIPPNTEIPATIELPQTFVCYAIGGQHATKKMPLKRIVELCSTINQPVVLIGGKEDTDVGAQIEATCNHVISLCGQLSIDQSALIIDRSQWLITHDTGMMHIGAALGKRIASIWGNTIPEFGMYPYRSDTASQVFEVNGLSCRPCSKIGHEKCPKGHFQCMMNQNLEEIASLIHTTAG